MPITVKYSPSAAALGGAAFEAGRGQRAERDLDRVRQERARRESLLIQQIEAEKNRQLRREETQAQLSLYNQREERMAEDRAADRTFRQRVYEEAPARALQESIEQSELLKDRFRWEYTEQQKREMAKIQDAIGWLRQSVSSGEWTPEQAEIAERQLLQRFHGIQSTPSMIYDDSPRPEDIYRQRSFVDENGRRIFIDDNGKFYAMNDPKQELAGRMAIEAGKMWTDLSKITVMKETGKGADGKPIMDEVPLYSDEQKVIMIKRLYGVDFGTPQAVSTTGEGTDTEEGMEADLLSSLPQEVTTSTQAVFDKMMKDLEDIHFGRADEKSMIETGKAFVANLESQGIPQNVAAKLYFEYWENAWDKSRWYKDDVVPKPKKDFDYRVLMSAQPKTAENRVWIKSKNEQTGNTIWHLGGTNESPSSSKTVDGLPAPKTKTEYDKLPPGTRYVRTDGLIAIKR